MEVWENEGKIKETTESESVLRNIMSLLVRACLGIENGKPVSIRRREFHRPRSTRTPRLYLHIRAIGRSTVVDSAYTGGQVSSLEIQQLQILPHHRPRSAAAEVEFDWEWSLGCWAPIEKHERPDECG